MSKPLLTTNRPTELAITIAALADRYVIDGWKYADEIRGRLTLLGFDVSGQQVVASLRRMSQVDAPWVESRKSYGRELQYRVTPYGRNDIENRLGLGLR